MPSSMRIAVIIPAYNEERHIEAVLRQLPAEIAGLPTLPIVVNDGSRDQTAALAQAVPGVTVLSHRTNLGKGAAAKTGCDAAYLMGADVFVLMDGDGQHRIEDIERIVRVLVDSESEQVRDHLVVGTRQLGGAMPLMMQIGNRSLTVASHVLFNIHTRDTQSGFRAFTRAIYPKIRWVASNYAMETEMLILAALNRVPVSEVTIPTVYHDSYKGTTVIDGFRILKTLVKWRLLVGQQLRAVRTGVDSAGLADDWEEAY